MGVDYFKILISNLSLLQNQNKLLIKTIFPISNKFIEFYPILVNLNGKSQSLIIPMISLKPTTLNVVMIINDRVKCGSFYGGHNVHLKFDDAYNYVKV